MLSASTPCKTLEPDGGADSPADDGASPFHSPPWTEHAFVGAGEEPCVIIMLGSRSGPGVHYPVLELAARYGASVAEDTSDWRQAYATLELFRRERPPNWTRLPWG